MSEEEKIEPIVDAVETPVPTVKSLSKEEIETINAGCREVLLQVLDFLKIEHALVTTEVSQSGSGEKLVLTCRWAYEYMPDGHMFKGNFFFQPGDKPDDARQIIAMQITLGINPLGAGYYIMADTMARFSHKDKDRNSPPEVFIRAVLSDMKKSGKISWMQASQALAEVIHLQKNIDETYGVDTAELMKQAGDAKKIQIAKR
jgi:hypothetical protein